MLTPSIILKGVDIIDRTTSSRGNKRASYLKRMTVDLKYLHEIGINRIEELISTLTN
jgi:hypothetical protein